MYIYARKQWPNFTWDEKIVNKELAQIKFLQGKLLGKMEQLGFDIQNQANFEIITTDIIKTSEIEGEFLNLDNVRSSVAAKLGIEQGGYKNKNIDGITQMTIEAINNYDKSLTKKRILTWHKELFSNYNNALYKMNIGKFRNKNSGDMHIISGPIGKEIIHFQAPKYSHINQDITKFLQWYNANNEDLVIKAAIAHFWFVTIHPFDDGNGRITRIISDMTLARSENSRKRFYSMSAQILKERKKYYEILEQCQKANLNITEWIIWFLNCLARAMQSSDIILDKLLKKAKFWQKNINTQINERQKNIINMLLDNFEGNLTSSKWAKINKCSQDTALRDINDLVTKNILVKQTSGGRSTNYILKIILL